ncbi:nin1 rpn12 binding protein, putative [Ichthyophthirius multifiliis]|uniref:Nin1 rpn12 binding protein, putative n=1 Tax=Ichthyophthirius multifiliis TaxID=5932 RepID=G0QX67_ICHMU|nr:nin1 rpn12 binding protein, putative [Ichthyophthirius multifiliis]EGR30184.1 nin1 rpn12 binding protein, putative [Ichthyophthirius multifiliis]|eukprot:XP_004031746.1 nin1 rpn12 binding protein, putative [Ichthyophthirius multifiliis]
MWDQDLAQFQDNQNEGNLNVRKKHNQIKLIKIKQKEIRFQKKKIVIDTNAFIKCLDLQKMSLTYDLYTTSEVIFEIKDKKAREKYQALCLNIQIKEPSNTAKAQIQKFSVLTGDNASLSNADIDLLALCYTFSEENNTSNLLRKQPLEAQEAYPKQKEGDAQKPEEEEEEEEEEKEEEEKEKEEKQNQDEDDEWTTVKQKQVKDKKIQNNRSEFENDQNNQNNINNNDINLNNQNEKNQNQMNLKENIQNQDEIESDSSEDDCEGWINNENLHLYKEQGHEKASSEENQFGFSLMTVDYSMQNVALQMGIPLISIDGMLIRKARKFVLECFACYEIIKDTKKQFCPKCQNHTLLKVSCSINADGTIKLYRKKNFQLCKKGFIYSIPNPKTGRNAHNIVLREDELLQGSKLIKVKIANKIQDKEYKKNMADFENGFGFGEIRSNKISTRDIQFGYGKINANNPNQFRRYKNKN